MKMHIAKRYGFGGWHWCLYRWRYGALLGFGEWGEVCALARRQYRREH